MKRSWIWAVACAGLLAGCATLSRPLQSRGETEYREGLAALARGEYRQAYERLAWVTQHYGHEAIGQQALLAMAALELDPRNPARRMPVGADLAASYLRLPRKAEWTQPVAQTLYLLALELGAAEDRAERAQRQAERASRLPTLPGPTVSARLRTVEQERERLAKRVDTLEKQLAEKDQELERIKKTIRP